MHGDTVQRFTLQGQQQVLDRLEDVLFPKPSAPAPPHQRAQRSLGGSMVPRGCQGWARKKGLFSQCVSRFSAPGRRNETCCCAPRRFLVNRFILPYRRFETHVRAPRRRYIIRSCAPRRHSKTRTRALRRGCMIRFRALCQSFLCPTQAPCHSLLCASQVLCPSIQCATAAL